jgi:FkbM family methyltransferase
MSSLSEKFTDMKRIDRPEAVYWFPSGVTHNVDRFIRDGAEPWLRHRMLALLEQRPGSVISAGSYVGGLLPWLTSRSEWIWSWEAVAEHVACTQQMLDYNNITNVSLVHAALGEAPGVAAITTGCVGSNWLGGASCIVRDAQPISPVVDLSKWTLRIQHTPQATIDSGDYPNLSILQLDIEGAEHLALQGAVQTIDRWNPTVIIENNTQADKLLSKWGYTPIESYAGDTIYTRSRPR